MFYQEKLTFLQLNLMVMKMLQAINESQSHPAFTVS